MIVIFKCATVKIKQLGSKDFVTLKNEEKNTNYH